MQYQQIKPIGNNRSVAYVEKRNLQISRTINLKSRESGAEQFEPRRRTAEQIVVKITDQNMWLHMVITSHYHNSKVPFVAILSELIIRIQIINCKSQILSASEDDILSRLRNIISTNAKKLAMFVLLMKMPRQEQIHLWKKAKAGQKLNRSQTVGWKTQTSVVKCRLRWERTYQAEASSRSNGAYTNRWRLCFQSIWCDFGYRRWLPCAT